MVVKKGTAQKPHRSKRSGTFTPAAKEIFLLERSRGLTIKQAARKAGVDPVTVFTHARKNPEFKARYEDAQELTCDALEALMEELGRSGNIAALFGTLKKMRPAVWGQHVKIEHGGNIGITGPEELAAARERATQRALAAGNGAMQH